jgi:hypothetical protein
MTASARTSTKISIAQGRNGNSESAVSEDAVVKSCSSDTSLILIIADNVFGLSAEKLQELEEKPHYMNSTDERLDLRHGLGLLLVRQIVEAHEGTMQINSVANHFHLLSCALCFCFIGINTFIRYHEKVFPMKEKSCGKFSTAQISAFTVVCGKQIIIFGYKNNTC